MTEQERMTEQELTYNINQELRCYASGFHSIHESRIAILSLIDEAGYVKLDDIIEGKVEVLGSGTILDLRRVKRLK